MPAYDLAEAVRLIASLPRLDSTDLPLVGVDECLNRKDLEAALEGLVRERIIRRNESFWVQFWETPSGEYFTLGGSRLPSDPTLRGSRQRKHTSWSDFQVACQLLAQWESYNQIVFLSENVRRNEGGIRRILETIIAPVLEEVDDKRLRLLALFKRPKTSYACYITEVCRLLREHQLSPGADIRLL